MSQKNKVRKKCSGEKRTTLSCVLDNFYLCLWNAALKGSLYPLPYEGSMKLWGFYWRHFVLLCMLTLTKSKLEIPLPLMTEVEGTQKCWKRFTCFKISLYASVTKNAIWNGQNFKLGHNTLSKMMCSHKGLRKSIYM